MDMQVNTDAFSSASSSLKKHCRIIEQLTIFLLKQLANARADFDDVNYDRTAEAAASVKREISDFSRKVDALDKDLKTLEDIVNEYANGGYGR